MIGIRRQRNRSSRRRLPPSLDSASERAILSLRHHRSTGGQVDLLYRRVATVEAAPMQDETILFNPATNSFCVLNPSAALVWQSLETPQPATVLASQLCEAFEGVTQDQARR